jgi:hypothetical protein
MGHDHDNSKQVLSSLAVMAEEIQASVEGMEAETPEPTEAPAQQAGPQVIQLDTEDALRLENMMLRSQVAQMSVKLAQSQAKEQQDSFQNHLIAKFGIDTSRFQLQVNPTDHTVAVVPR